VEFHLQSTIDDIVIRKDLFENIEDFKGEVQNQAFSITHRKNNEYTCLAEFNPDSRMEIASLTKIMTCLLVLMIAEKFKIDLRHAYAKVGHKGRQSPGHHRQTAVRRCRVCVGSATWHDAAQWQ
jgi:hypothetical protein